MTREQFIGTPENWDSHKTLLWEALQLTTGKVIELGAGFGSTPYLDKFCKENDREFESYENNLKWLTEEFNAQEYPNLHYIENWDDVILECGVLFVDHAPGPRRKVDIERAAFTAQIIVAHDTEINADHGYQMRGELSKFKYMIDHKTSGAWTTAVSNYIDVTTWKF